MARCIPIHVLNQTDLPPLLQEPSLEMNSEALKAPMRHIPIPPELWLDIFGCHSWSRKEMGNVRLVSKSFSELLRPLIFRTLTIHPSVIQKCTAPPSISPFSQEDTDRTIQRLDCLLSPHVAPHVNHIRVYPSSGYGIDVNDIGDTDFILDALFEKLPQFTSLQALYFEDMSFSAKTLRGLCQVSKNLKRIDIHDSWIPGEAYPKPECALEADLLNLHLTRSYPYGRWAEYLQPDAVREIRLCIGDHAVAERFMKATSNLPLTHLTMTYNYRTLAAFLQKSSPTVWGRMSVLCLHLDYVTQQLLELVCSRCCHVCSLDLTIKNRPNDNCQFPRSNEKCTIKVSILFATFLEILNLYQEFIASFTSLSLPAGIQSLRLNFQDPNLASRGHTPLVNEKTGRSMCLPLKERLYAKYPALDHIHIDISLYRGSWSRSPIC